MPHLCSPSPSWFRQYFNEQGYQFIHTCLEHIQGVPPILSDEEQGNLLRGNWQLFGCGLRSVVQVYYKALKDSFSNKFSLFNLKSIKEDTKKVAHGKKKSQKCKTILSNCYIELKNYNFEPFCFMINCVLKLRFCEKETKFLQNHHLRFVLCSNGQIYGGDFAKFCGLLRIYELYQNRSF